jgi:dTDP-glucose pyrophosphorylase/predicted transcriptional regulator
MHDLKKLFISPGTKLIDALQRLDKGAAQIVLVVDDSERLVGTVTDGDMRRAVLRGVSMEDPVSNVMNAQPMTANEGITEEAAIALMRSRTIHQLPIIAADRRVVNLITLDEALRKAREETIVVLMAGGLGSRMRPLTESTPKPLLPIGGRPLLEITIATLARQGFERFYVSVNYKAEMFRAHFADGKQMGVDIRYVEETEQLGTAGALRLLPERPGAPILVMNGDILTNFDARQLMAFHRAQGTAATMCVREYEWQIPYGVVETSDGKLTGFHEKPKRREFVSAGINVLSPEALDLIPADGRLDMPTLFQTVSQSIAPPSVYTLQEYWLDIGHLEDLQRAQNDIQFLT